jgi:hypothetical protein
MGNCSCPSIAYSPEEDGGAVEVAAESGFASLPDEVAELIVERLPFYAFLSLRGACKKMRGVSSRLSVEGRTSSLLSSPAKSLPSFADDIQTHFKGLCFSWELHQTSRISLYDKVETVLFQLFRLTTTSDTDDDQVRCIIARSSERKRRVPVVCDAPPSLESIFPMISRFRNLKALALTRFELDEHTDALLRTLHLDSLYLTACVFRPHLGDFSASNPFFYSLDLRNHASLRRLFFEPIPVDALNSFRQKVMRCRLPSSLVEIEVSVPKSMDEATVFIYADGCRTLEKM